MENNNWWLRPTKTKRKVNPIDFTNCTTLNIEDPEEDVARAKMLMQQGYKILDLCGNGNCMLCAVILGMALNERLHSLCMQSKNHLAAVMYKMRKDLTLFVGTNASTMWQAVPKSDEGEILDIQCIWLDPDLTKENIFKIMGRENCP